MFRARLRTRARARAFFSLHLPADPMARELKHLHDAEVMIELKHFLRRNSEKKDNWWNS